MRELAVGAKSARVTGRCFSLLLVDLLEDVFEATVVLLQDGVLGAEVERPAFGQSHLEGAVGKVPDGLVCIVHPQGYTPCAWTDIQTPIYTSGMVHSHMLCNVFIMLVWTNTEEGLEKKSLLVVITQPFKVSVSSEVGLQIKQVNSYNITETNR